MTKLFIWLISQDTNNDYDTYGQAVVVAPDADSAKFVYPWSDRNTGMPILTWSTERGWVTIEDGQEWGGDDWVSPDLVTARCVGEAAEGLSAGQVISASFRAG